MLNEVLESYLMRICHCSVRALRQYLCRAEFAHVQRICDYGINGRKDNVRYLHLTRYDIERLNILMAKGKRYKYHRREECF